MDRYWLRSLGCVLTIGLFLAVLSLFVSAADARAEENAVSLWEMAQSARADLVITTLFIESTVSSKLSTDDGIKEAIRWCKFNGITKVYLETFRNGRQAKRDVLVRARDKFIAEGFAVSGCVTTTNIGKAASHLDGNGKMVTDHLACYTAGETRQAMENLFEFTASIFDEIIIDDFYCTNCECELCAAAKGGRSWSEYRADTMLEVSRDCVIAAASSVNPDCRITIKYPNWYDHFISAGYDVSRETQLFPYIYTGTETREPDSSGSNPQYGGYFLMQWLNDAGQGKNRGGWFDYIDTEPDTFVEQAIQTVLGGAREIMLFRYAPLASAAEEADIRSLHSELPQLFRLAKMIKGKQPRGIAAPKSHKSSDRHEKSNKLGQDKYLFSFAGMIGLPLVPTLNAPEDAPAALFTQHALYDQANLAALRSLAVCGAAVLVTDGLLAVMDDPVDASADNVHVLEIKDSNKRILRFPEEELNSLRDTMLAPLGIKFHSPARVAIYLYDDDLLAIENFNDHKIQATFSRKGAKFYEKLFSIPEGSDAALEQSGDEFSISLPPRCMTVISIKK